MSLPCFVVQFQGFTKRRFSFTVPFLSPVDLTQRDHCSGIVGFYFNRILQSFLSFVPFSEIHEWRSQQELGLEETWINRYRFFEMDNCFFEIFAHQRGVPVTKFLASRCRNTSIDNISQHWQAGAFLRVIVSQFKNQVDAE